MIGRTRSAILVPTRAVSLARLWHDRLSVRAVHPHDTQRVRARDRLAAAEAVSGEGPDPLGAGQHVRGAAVTGARTILGAWHVLLLGKHGRTAARAAGSGGLLVSVSRDDDATVTRDAAPPKLVS